MLRLLGVKKSFAGRTIIDIPELAIGNACHWLRGANGSGKTTLLKILAGLSPFAGDVILDGISLKKNGLAYRQKISWAEAEPMYPGFLKGKELIGLYADSRKPDPRQIKMLTDRFAVADYIDQPTGTYSSGMLKRLSLLLAFTGRASCILMDEPLLTLDTDIAGILLQLMEEYRRENDTSFIYSSHQSFPDPGPGGESVWEMNGQTIAAS